MRSNTKLLPGPLEYSRLLDANAENPSNSSINSVQFHRNALFVGFRNIMQVVENLEMFMVMSIGFGNKKMAVIWSLLSS